MSACLRTNLAGFQYEELACLYPAWGSFFTDFELQYDPVVVRDIMAENNLVPTIACLFYGVGIVVGKRYFRKRDPWNWRGLLALWNFGLSLFSAVGFVRTFPHVLHMLSTLNLEQLMCSDPENTFGSGSTGLWVQLFVLSKFPELLDTLFIVVHKKKLIFLHWYHHVTVLLYCWHSYVTKAPGGIFFVVMNYGVHAVMYFYYFLMAIKLRPKWGMLVTTLQISQMVVGVALTAMGFIFVGTEGCAIKNENNVAAFLMYGSYLFLFLQFFIGRYFGPMKPKKKKKKTA